MTAFRSALPGLELESLRQLAGGVSKSSIPLDHGEILVRGGFATAKAGTLLVTTMGHAKLAYEITRTSWSVAPV